MGFRSGTIYHASSRRRREVLITAALHQAVTETADAIRVMLASGRLPPPVNDRRCDECSLKGICEPAITAADKRRQAALNTLYEPE